MAMANLLCKFFYCLPMWLGVFRSFFLGKSLLFLSPHITIAGGCRPRSLRRARGAAPRRAQNRSCCLVSRATHAGHFRYRAHCGQSARAALAGGTGGQRAHAPMPVSAFPSAVLAHIHPIFARSDRAGRLAGMSHAPRETHCVP